jgi:hypothetical protein
MEQELMDEDLIDNFLARLKTEGRSSPLGQHWARFHSLLCGHAGPVPASRPPVPLILAASGESDHTKHRRLAEQLRWAQTNGVLKESLQFLVNLQPDQWNECAAKDWSRSNY